MIDFLLYKCLIESDREIKKECLMYHCSKVIKSDERENNCLQFETVQKKEAVGARFKYYWRQNCKSHLRTGKEKWKSWRHRRKYGLVNCSIRGCTFTTVWPQALLCCLVFRWLGNSTNFFLICICFANDNCLISSYLVCKSFPITIRLYTFKCSKWFKICFQISAHVNS